MLERRLCVYNAGLKVDASREILTVVMMSYYENVYSCKRHTVVRRTFCFWRFALLFLVTTVSLDIHVALKLILFLPLCGMVDMLVVFLSRFKKQLWVLVLATVQSTVGLDITRT